MISYHIFTLGGRLLALWPCYDAPNADACISLRAGLLAARHLTGRRLLPGTPVVLPALGSDCVFCVVEPKRPGGA